MDINLRCRKCELENIVSYSTLIPIWNEGYKQMPEDKKSEVSLTAMIECPCGNREKYDSPMFCYTFKTVFEEFLALQD